ncbi:MAG: hypothetical protein WC073_03585 [Sterolibacterium sp.]
MKMDILQDKALRWVSLGLAILLVLAVGAAVMLNLRNGELETLLSKAQEDKSNLEQTGALALKKLQDDIKVVSAKAATLEQKQDEADKMKTLLAKVEPQLTVVLEAAGNAKGSKADARSVALASLGLIGQIAHGTNNEAASALLDRALAIDKTNCVAGLAINLGGAKKIDVAPDCAALLSVAAPASEAKPAAEMKPAAEAKPAPAGDVAKEAQTAAKH